VGAVLMIKDVKAGKRPPPVRPSFMIHHGQFTYPSGVHRAPTGPNYSSFNIAFGPIGERMVFSTGGLFPCEVVLKSAETDKVVFEGTARAYSDPKRPDHVFLATDWMSKPKPVTSDPIRKGGMYVATCRRHAWQSGYLFLVDNPYVCVTTHNSRGRFTIGNIPAGRYTAEVWHQDLQPVRREIEFEVKKDETTQFLVEFKMPEA
ncbi:hypothetical protein LCGC14_2559370, partial [marine sediment metagenome]